MTQPAASPAPIAEAPAASSDSGWHRGPLVGFDLETTGTDPLTARVVTAAVVYVDPDGTMGPRSRTWLVDPGVPIPPQATEVHGISTEDARERGAPPAAAIPEILHALYEAWNTGCPMVVFNAAYDLSLINAAALRHGLEPVTASAAWQRSAIIDPLVIDRGVDRYRKGKRTLSAAAQHYGVSLVDAHAADADAVAACLVARAIGSAFPDVGAADLDALQAMQSQWSTEWAVSFQAYLRSRGRADAVIDGTWPLRTH